MVTSLLISTLQWESEVWSTGASHILDTVKPTYYRFTQLITGLPSYTESYKVLGAAGIPPLILLLDRKYRNYGIGILLTEINHTDKALLRSAIPRNKGLRRGKIKFHLQPIIPPSVTIEDCPGPNFILDISNIKISQGTKEEVARSHEAWLRSIHSSTIIYSDGSKNSHTCFSRWHIVTSTNIIYSTSTKESAT